MAIPGKLGILRRMMRDRSGNFGIMTALLLPCLLGAAGMAVDLANAYQERARLGAIADSAALAAASALREKNLTPDQAKKLAEDFIDGQVAINNVQAKSLKKNVTVDVLEKSSSGTKYEVGVSLAAAMDTSLMQILGTDNIEVGNSAKAQSSTGTKNSLSMYLVLDRSGSMQASVTTSVRSTTKACTYYYMNSEQTAVQSKPNYLPCYYQRIEVMQSAVSQLLDTLRKSDPGQKLVRTGADAFNNVASTPENMGWGVERVDVYVKKLTAVNGTSSTAAFKAGVDALLDPAENNAHMAKNGLTPKKYIIFMTDGENNATADNTKTLDECSRAKTGDVTVYTVGFMLASAKAKNFLLSCASSDQTYYDATDGALLAAAFASIAQQTSGGLPLLTN